MLRFTLGAVLVIGLASAIFTIIGWATARALDGHGFGIAGLLPLIAIIVAIVVVARVVRRTGTPVADLIEAAGRVERGDLAARLEERGPSELRSVARAFNAMGERLEANESARRRLFADVSHELRTPLSVIQGNLEGVLDGVYPADRAHLAPILDEARQLARLIDDLRTLSVAEAGALHLDRTEHAIGPLLSESVASFRPQAAAAGVTLAMDAPDGLPAVEVDATRIREVLANVVANALRATPRGGSVTLSARSAAPGVAVAVRDTGRGIDPELLPRLFDRFSRASDSPGSGLGLAIARRLVEAHGGAISADSEPGRGTTISFTLPLGSDAG